MDSANTFSGLKPTYKEAYSDMGKQTFKRLRQMLKTKENPKFTAKSEEEASKDPQGFMDKMKNANIKNVKGVAL